MQILLYDNNDSFTRNLEHLFALRCESPVLILPYAHLQEHGVEAGLALLTASDDEQILIVISPGPGSPQEYPAYGSVLESGLPVLGICLGMQIINTHFGGTVEPMPGCVHGRAERITILGRQVAVARYHSLAVTEVGRGLRVDAVNKDGAPMLLCHEKRSVMGYQFHPESFLTEDGGQFIDHALDTLGLA